MDPSKLLFVPTILFLVIVAPIWIIMHYRYKSRQSQGLSTEEHENLDHLLSSLDKLVDRVETLEHILNEDQSDWRGSPRQRNKRENSNVT